MSETLSPIPAVSIASSPAPAPGSDPATRPDPAAGAGPTREVRFAVVMYGGVSLAIYINGVAQELLHLVRATAPAGDEVPGTMRFSDHVPGGAADPERLTRVEQVYRDLARHLDQRRVAGTPVEPDAPVRARFVVDILSGTSAGGINAVFLAKALANGQSIRRLQDLWLAEADIRDLINDSASVRGLALSPPEHPESLLNGERMYLKLLDAFDGMDYPDGSDRSEPEPRPLVRDVDLFVTATDIEGVGTPLRLSDRTVQERRHRSVFHFSATRVRSHFGPGFNPFLAFVSRCTSAFPFAFAPMRLCDIDPVLTRHDRYRTRVDCHSASQRWQPFFAEFAGSSGAGETPVPQRSFGDGGYLDNKPFSYATETLLRREATLPVDRKLIYVEPAPEHPERVAVRTGRPDAVENVLAATVGLPRYETIREDLERLIARNRLTERVRTITGKIEEDVRRGLLGESERLPFEDAATWGSRDLARMVRAKGVAYGGYHRLRVAATTDTLAGAVTRAAGFNEGSAHRSAVRYLLRAWREDSYVPYTPAPPAPPADGSRPPAPAPKQLENQFLLEFDLEFRIRRLAHVLAKVDVLYPLGRGDAEDIVARAGARWPAEEEKKGFRAELLAIRSALFPHHGALVDMAAALGAGDDPELRRLVEALAVPEKKLLKLLEPEWEPARDDEAQTLLRSDGLRERIEALMEYPRRLSAHARASASAGVRDALDPARLPSPAAYGRHLARQVLWYYYRHFDDYDMVAFPILYNTDAGEQDTVEVVRISPEDAVSLVKKGETRRKLAGTALFNFGAFLDRVWRANDLLWGRLDGAERLICALLPDPKDDDIRRELVERANRAILQDYLDPASRSEMSRLLVESLVRATAGETGDQAVRRVVDQLKATPLEGRLGALVTACLDEEQVLEYFRSSYEVRPELDRGETLRVLARGTRVVGKMLEGITERRGGEGSRSAWLTRVGSVFWGFVEAAVPGSLASYFWWHWLKVLYLFEGLLLVLGLLLDPDVANFAARVLALTGLAHATVLLLRDHILHRLTVLRLLGAALVLTVAVFALVGASRVFGVRWSFSPLVEAGIFAPGLPQLAGGLAALLGAPIVLLGVAGALGAGKGGGGGAADPLPQGFRQPGMAMEFVRSDAEILAIARDGGRRRKILEGLNVDYVFIAVYAVFFLVMALLLLAGRSGEWTVWRWSLGHWPVLAAAGACAVAGVAAAIFDVVENVRIHGALALGWGRGTDEAAHAIRSAALAKWGLVFAAGGAASTLFLTAESPLAQAVGGFWLAVSLFGGFALVRAPRLVEPAFFLLGVGLLTAAVLFLAFPALVGLG